MGLDNNSSQSDSTLLLGPSRHNFNTYTTNFLSQISSSYWIIKSLFLMEKKIKILQNYA